MKLRAFYQYDSDTVDNVTGKTYLGAMALNRLETYRDRTDFRLDELLEVANGFVELVAPEQPSERVAEKLNERTLRYYISEGLVDRPIGKEGTSALYGYRHLLQLLALKRLQASYLPIRRIKEILAGKNEEELKGILAGKPEEPGTDARQRAQAYLDSLVAEPESAVCANLATLPMKLENPQPSLQMTYHSQAPIPERKSSTSSSGAWERFVLGDGFELHVRSDRLRALGRTEARKIVERIWDLLKRMAGREKRS